MHYVKISRRKDGILYKGICRFPYYKVKNNKNIERNPNPCLKKY